MKIIERDLTNCYRNIYSYLINKFLIIFSSYIIYPIAIQWLLLDRVALLYVLGIINDLQILDIWVYFCSNYISGIRR